MKGEYYRMDFNAWDEGTFDLSLEQEAAYLRLCHQMYRRGGPIPNSRHLLCAIFRSGHTRATALLSKLIKAGKIFVTEDGQLANQRVLRELIERNELLAKKKAAGHYGGIQNRRVGGVANLDQTPTKPQPSAEQVPSTFRPKQANSLKTNASEEAYAQAQSKLGEERRGEEKKESSLRSPKKVAMNGHDPPNRGCRLAATWQPSVDDTAFAASLDLGPLRIAAIADHFRDYWLSAAGKTAVKLDWSAAWRNWVRKDVEDQSASPPKPLRRDPYGRNY